MKKQVSIIWLIISAVLIILTGALLAYVYWQRSEMRNFKEHINIENEREKLEEEYGLTDIPDGYSLHHDTENGVMQLIKDDYHKKFTHAGGYSIFKEDL